MAPHLCHIKSLDKFHKKYKVSTLLGTGGNGSVYLCQEINTRISRAVKIVSQSVKQTFCRIRKRMVPCEVALWEPLTHENTVQLVEVFADEDNKTWYMVMEYLDSFQELFSYVNTHGSISTRDSSRVIQQLVGVVSHLHHLGVDHRDIKDENILYHPKTKQIKLIDFGSATLLSPHPYTSLRGTDIYIPPEFYLHGKYHADAAAVWSVGCLSFILLRGDNPFKSPESVRNFSSMGDFKDDSLLVETKRVDFIKQCLQPVVEKRMKLSELLKHPWLKL